MSKKINLNLTLDVDDGDLVQLLSFFRRKMTPEAAKHILGVTPSQESVMNLADLIRNHVDESVQIRVDISSIDKFARISWITPKLVMVFGSVNPMGCPKFFLDEDGKWKVNECKCCKMRRKCCRGIGESF